MNERPPKAVQEEIDDKVTRKRVAARTRITCYSTLAILIPWAAVIYGLGLDDRKLIPLGIIVSAIFGLIMAQIWKYPPKAGKKKHR